MSTTLSNEIYKKAEAALAAKFGVTADKVQIGVGEEEERGVVYGGDYQRPSHLVISVEKSGIDANQKDSRETFLKAMSEIEAMNAVAQTIPDEKLAPKLLNDIKTAIAGTKFNTKLLEWSGFNPDVVKNGWAVENHAITWVQANGYGIEFHLAVPVDKNTDLKAQLEKVRDSIKADLPIIHKTLEDRTIKYVTENLTKDGKSKEDIEAKLAEIKTDFAKLEIDVNVDGNNNNIVVSIRDPDQAKAKAKGGTHAEPDNADELRKHNSLHLLRDAVTEVEKEANPKASPQLHKTLGRAFLLSGEKAMERFPLIAGRKDIENAIAKELVHTIRAAEKEAPEKVAALKAVLKEVQESNLLKEHGYSVDPKNPDQAPPKPKFQKHFKEHDKMHIWIEIPEEKIKPTIEALANTPHDTACHMAKVDSIELVGAQTKHPEVKDALAPLTGKQLPPNEAGEKLIAALEQAQEKINHKVEHAEHKRIELCPEHAKKLQEEVARTRHAVSEIDAALAQLPKPQMTPQMIMGNCAPSMAMGA